MCIPTPKMKATVGVKGPWTPEEIAIKDKLEAMVKLPENQECADCTARAPKWAVFNHGIFVCIKCSGQHRGLGAAISKVRSITLDRWKPDQLAQMCGNAVANARLLYNLPAGLQKPQEEDDNGRVKWIQQKYVKKAWEWREGQPALQAAPTPSSAQHVPSTTHAVENPPQTLQHPQQHNTNQIQIQNTNFLPPQQGMVAPGKVPRGNDDLLDLFGDFNDASGGSSALAHPQSHAQLPVTQKPQIEAVAASAPVSGHNSTFDDPFADIFGGSAIPRVVQEYQQKNPQKVTFQPQSNQQTSQAKFNPTDFLAGNSKQQQTVDYKPIGFNW